MYGTDIPQLGDLRAMLSTLPLALAGGAAVARIRAGTGGLRTAAPGEETRGSPA